MKEGDKNRDALKILREVNKKHPMVWAEGYNQKFDCRYVIYQWNCHGFIIHANFFYPIKEEE